MGRGAFQPDDNSNLPPSFPVHSHSPASLSRLSAGLRLRLHLLLLFTLVHLLLPGPTKVSALTGVAQASERQPTEELVSATAEQVPVEIASYKLSKGFFLPGKDSLNPDAGFLDPESSVLRPGTGSVTPSAAEGGTRHSFNAHSAGRHPGARNMVTSETLEAGGLDSHRESGGAMPSVDHTSDDAPSVHSSIVASAVRTGRGGGEGVLRDRLSEAATDPFSPGPYDVLSFHLPQASQVSNLLHASVATGLVP